MRIRLVFCVILCFGAARGASPIVLRSRLIAGDLKGGYQVLATDLNRDRRPDLIALSSSSGELAWFENPGWRRHVIARGLRGLINVAAADLDGDGLPELAVAWEFSMRPRESAGLIGLLRAGHDPRQPWSLRELDRLPASHRLRFATVDGKPPGVLVNAPLAGALAEPPDYSAPVPLVLYRPATWARETVSEELQGVLHGLAVTDWNNDGREEILTASFRGLDLFERTPQGWRRTRLADGNPQPWPRSGASEVAVGRLGRTRFLAAIEPWHGHLLVVYLPQADSWRRVVLDDRLAEGHALETADFDGDRRDEIVAGYRARGGGLLVYRAQDGSGQRWEGRKLESGAMATSSCVVADLNADRRPDLACVGGAELRWFENLTPARRAPVAPAGRAPSRSPAQFSSPAPQADRRNQ
ncbi:MAG: VCBS repeat-containing protein [Bryobacteraceae bacterium]|nr:VCBS repeat-containing protein [Bryobacteraceae bacterium]